MFKVYNTPAYRFVMKKYRLSTADRFVTMIPGSQTKVHILVSHCQRVIKPTELFKHIPPDEHTRCSHCTE